MQEAAGGAGLDVLYTKAKERNIANYFKKERINTL